MNIIDKVLAVGITDGIIKAYKEGLSPTSNVYVNPYDKEMQVEEYYAFDVGYKESFYEKG